MAMSSAIENQPRKHAAWAAAVIVAGVVVGLALQWGGPILPEDDSYITFRYVRNVIGGRGLVYNESQRVCGVSCPLYMLTVSGLSAVIRSIPVDVLAVRLNFIPWAATGILSYLLLRKWLDSAIVASVGGLVVLFDPPLLGRVGDGMESFYFTMWALLTFLALTKQRHLLAGIAAGLATLTRPEGVLLVPILMVVQVRSWKKAMASIALFGLVLLPWGLFAWRYYGTPVPHSIVAKMRPLYPIPPGYAARQIATQLGPLRLAAVLIGSVGVIRARKRTGLARLQWLPAAFFWLLILFYAVTNPFMFGWYYPPVYVTGLLTIACGFTAIARSLAAWFTETFEEGPSTRWNAAPSVAVGVMMVAAIALQFAVNGYRRPTDEPDRQRLLAYKECANYLRAHVPPGETVAAAEIGALGYWYDGKLLDVCGLVSPEAIPYLPVPANERVAPDVGAVPVRLIEDARPAWVVSMPYFIRKGLARSSWFNQAYELATTVPLPQPLWGDRAVMIFKKR